MAFTIDQTVIHIKITDKGRELLSRGELTFKKFAIGDSEIDYGFNSEIGLNAENAEILRPVDKNPELISFVLQNNDTGNTFTSLPSVSNNTSIITNTSIQRGMFDVTGSTKLFNDPSHVKQPDIQIIISNITGGQSLTLNKAPSYGANPTEPIIGDYLLVKWVNPEATGDSTGFNANYSIPYIWYKIEDITSGALSSDNLVVVVDRELPDFAGSGGGLVAGALVYPHNKGRQISGDSIQNYYGAPFISDFVSESVFAFLENYDVPTIDVPVWNMTMIFTDEIAGVDITDRNISQYYSSTFGGFVNYIQRLDTSIKNIGLIHYTNLSPSNNYGEGLLEDTPILDIPSIMWHKSPNAKIGLTLSADTSSNAQLPDLNTQYHNLVDQQGNVLGKVFNDLKIFVIEDQELLFAMSYKSNRNWTLPPVNANFNVSLCPESDVEVTAILIP